MNILDIIGPVMVGPSSSHTAGAVRIGLAGRKLMGSEIIYAEIYFHGSFLATGRGHGTDRALVAGLLGYGVADERIPDSFRFAKENGLQFTIDGIDLGDEAHPNSVKMKLTGTGGKKLEIIASSIGGGRIQINEIDGLTVNVSGDYPTLIVHNQDQPGHVTEVTSMLAHKSVNIAAMQLYRLARGGNAVMVLECDQEVPEESIRWLEHLEGIHKVTYLSLKSPEEIYDCEMKADKDEKAETGKEKKTRRPKEIQKVKGRKEEPELKNERTDGEGKQAEGEVKVPKEQRYIGKRGMKQKREGQEESHV